MQAGSWFLRSRHGLFEIRVAERLLLLDGASVPIRGRAFGVLVVMVESHGQLISKDRLIECVWPRAVVEENALQVQISALRKILGADAIATVAGHGYRLVAEVVQAEEEQPRSPVSNLPNELSRFIGRESELALLEDSLRKTRLLTLTGAGGCGKTRLALRVAARLDRTFADGVFLAELAGVLDPGLVVQVVASSMKVGEQPNRLLVDLIVQSYRTKSVLLILDNAEHVLESCATLTVALLQHCPGLVILVTSRERLEVEGELVYRVPSLSLPEGVLEPELDDVLACESARLFIDRARLSDPQFTVSTQNAGVLASICRRLDGIALAIELAVPLLHSTSIEELERLLDDRFNVLTRGMRTRLPRQRTLRGMIDWSHDLLGDDERTLLRRLSIFRSWYLEAACEICGDAILDPHRVPRLLAALVEKNLIAADTRGGATRYRMLETIRFYANDRLRETAEESDLQQRHLVFLRSLVEGDTDAGPQRDLMYRIDLEQDNVRAVLSWASTSSRDGASGLQLATVMATYWMWRGFYSEGRDWLTRLLIGTTDKDASVVHASAYRWAGNFATRQADYAVAQRLHEKSLALYKQLDDVAGVSNALSYLGTIARDQGKYATSRVLYAEALDMKRRLGDSIGVARALINLGYVASEQGDYPTARATFHESLSVLRELQHWQASHALYHLGIVAYCEFDFETARDFLEQALDGHRAVENQQGVAECLAALGIVAHDCGNDGLALVQLKEALALQQKLGDRRNLAESLEAFAAAVSTLAAVDLAARLWGCTERMREEIGAPVTPSQRGWHDRHVAAARAVLKDDAFRRLWTEGRHLSLEAALAETRRFEAPAAH